MILFLLAVAFIAAVGAGSINSTNSDSDADENRIIGGHSARIETYPYQVSLQNGGIHFCGASIISSRYVVTAGHCVPTNTRRLTIRAGSSIVHSGGSVHEVDMVKRHENYGTTKFDIPYNDIAIMRVKQPFKFDNLRQPIPLFGAYEITRSGAMAVVTGWGATKQPTRQAVQLQTVTIPIITKSLCHQAYWRFGGVPDGQICAAYYGQGGKDACQGDSGGPLAIDGRLAGIVSWGYNCAEPDHPGAYTEVANYRDWIRRHTNV